ncbi:PadR family transcriptional regulator [Cellulomonas sp. HZM]|uniref:PadR family transcriptional regulator n=1 Tax=Cellulomonas sp. HZM TaxID=1454010 RepID=UPI0004936C1A|nr:PadR family transcriptional regulator [Cellulomonas sp. HZM]
MSRRPQTDLAVLGALSVEPMTGYALRAAIVSTLGHFWSESFGQIYPALARLEADGLVAKDDGRFTITAAGRTRLRDLLRTPVERTPPRNGLLLRLFFGSTLGEEACLDLLRDAADEAQATLATLASIRTEVEAEPDHPDKRWFLVTIAAGEATARAQARWARESLESLSPGMA